MESIYHIETDLECKVLHYGTELCIAKPGQDVSITLRKGRHKLTFVSTENPLDTYTMFYEVPENDIEDCIEVELKGIRKVRLDKEAEERRRALEAEKRRLAELEKYRRQERERREREELERKKRQEEERIIREDVEVLSSLFYLMPSHEYLRPWIRVFYRDTKTGEISDVQLKEKGPYEFLVKKGLYDFSMKLWLISPSHDVCTPFYNNRAFYGDYRHGKWSFVCVDRYLHVLFNVPEGWYPSSYMSGVSFLVKGSPKDAVIRIINTQGLTLLERTAKELSEKYTPLKEFPVSVIINTAHGTELQIKSKKEVLGQEKFLMLYKYVRISNNLTLGETYGVDIEFAEKYAPYDPVVSDGLKYYSGELHLRNIQPILSKDYDANREASRMDLERRRDLILNNKIK